jgi:hypothetical protein
MVIIHETREAWHTTCWLGASPAGCISIRIIMTLSDMSERLLIVVISYYVLLYWWHGLEDGYVYVYPLSDGLDWRPEGGDWEPIKILQ